MKLLCDVIRDLLPLYHDEVVGEESRKLVEVHLEECEECQTLLKKLRDQVLDEQIKRERDGVVEHHAQKVKHKGLLIGLWVALLMPIVVTFIVNLATARRLDWFYIVLTAMCLVASLTLVPLTAKKNKELWVLGSFIFTLLQLLFTIDNLYAQRSWFLIPAVAIMLGMSILFAPYVLGKLPLKGFASRHKGLIAMTVNTILLYALLVVIGVMVGSDNYWRIAFQIAAFGSLYPWLIFITIRYFKVNGFAKAGMCLFYSGLFVSLTNSIIYLILDGIWYNPWREANLFSWEIVDYVGINANINILTMLVCFIIGGIFIGVGLLRKGEKDA